MDAASTSHHTHTHTHTRTHTHTLAHTHTYTYTHAHTHTHTRMHTCMHRALKTKHETPKYGLIYHASLIGQSSAKFKGKVSRVLSAKCALATRVDALGDGDDASIGEMWLAYVRVC